MGLYLGGLIHGLICDLSVLVGLFSGGGLVHGGAYFRGFTVSYIRNFFVKAPFGPKSFLIFYLFGACLSPSFLGNGHLQLGRGGWRV